jgi:hypothetical protein
VWSSIALHTTHGVPEFMEPEIAVAAHPRDDFKRQALRTFAEGSKDRPDTSYWTVTEDVLAHFSPGYQRKDFIDVVMNSDWED